MDDLRRVKPKLAQPSNRSSELARSEASALTPVRSEALLKGLKAERAWWVAHDEGGLSSMVSIVTAPTGPSKHWRLHPVELTRQPDLGDQEPGGRRLTDAEALTSGGGFVFIIGSAFLGRDERHDRRRSFLARVPEASLALASDEACWTAPTEVLELGLDLALAVHTALSDAGIDLLELDKNIERDIATAHADEAEPHRSLSTSPSHTGSSHTNVSDTNQVPLPINIEGAHLMGEDLVLGLRWPVTSDGQPILIVVQGAASVLHSGPVFDSAQLLALPLSIVVVDAGGTRRRPVGIRSLAGGGRPDELDLLVGPTDRDIAERKVKASTASHLRLNLSTGLVAALCDFEGFRKVEGLAPSLNPDQPDGWIYALDDEDAVVLLVTDD